MKIKLGVILLVLAATLWCAYMYIHVTNPQLTQMQIFQSHWGYALSMAACILVGGALVSSKK